MANRLGLLLWTMMFMTAVCLSPTGVADEQQVPRYLLFEIFAGGPNGGVFHRGLSKERLVQVASQISRTVRPTSMSPDRIAGFSVGPIAMDLGEDEARSIIRDAFDVALATDMAVALHLDDYMFWGRARLTDGRLLRDKPNVIEWNDWFGTPAGSLEIGWLPNAALSPQMCYENPDVKAFVTYWTTNVIGQEIKKQVNRLAEAGKTKLFAGVIVGWESNLAYGYCSLSYLGYSASNRPADFERERQRILQRHIEQWAKGIYDAGIPQDRIFTHVATMPKVDYDRMKARGRLNDMQSAVLRAPWVAFNNHSIPGFSGYPTEGRFEEIYDAVGKFGPGPWAMSEGTNVRPDLSWESYLARIFNHDARAAIIFGGFQNAVNNEFARATESPEAISAYRKFLSGAKLIEAKGP